MEKKELAPDRLQTLTREVMGVTSAFMAEQSEMARESANQAVAELMGDRFTAFESRLESLEELGANLAARLQQAEQAPSAQENSSPSYWARLCQIFKPETYARPQK